jgi:hypothetical protein
MPDTPLATPREQRAELALRFIEKVQEADDAMWCTDCPQWLRKCCDGILCANIPSAWRAYQEAHNE